MSNNHCTPRPGRDGGRGSGPVPTGNWTGWDTSGPSWGRRRGRTPGQSEGGRGRGGGRGGSGRRSRDRDTRIIVLDDHSYLAPILRSCGFR